MSGITLNEKENVALLQIDTRFYGHLAVVVAAAEFAEHLWVQLDGNPESYLTIRLSPKSDDIDLAAASREFFNYMLELMGESLAALSGKSQAAIPKSLLSTQPDER